MKKQRENASRLYIITLFLVLGHFAVSQPPQIMYPTCEIASQFSEMGLEEDTIKYFQFGDFSKTSPFYQKIDSLALSMKIKIVNASHHKPLECYNDVVKKYFK
ncbi:MAG: hypothetical protein RJQ14_13215, partial [Marinoscillum sp.]